MAERGQQTMNESERQLAALAEGMTSAFLRHIRELFKPGGLGFKIDRIRVTDFGKERLRTVLTVRLVVRNRDPEATHLDSLILGLKEMDEELVPGHLDPQRPAQWITDFDPILIPPRKSKKFEIEFSRVSSGLLNHTNPTLTFEASDSLGRTYRFERLLYPSAPLGHEWTRDDYQEWLKHLRRLPEGKVSFVADDLDRLSRSLTRMHEELLKGYEKKAQRKMQFKISDEDLKDLRALKELWEFKLHDSYEVAWGYFLGQIARGVMWSSETGRPLSIT